MSDGECVKVIVRCRPMNQREKDLKCRCVIAMDHSKGQCQIHHPSDDKAPPKAFTFDGAYFTESTTEDIYNEIAYPLVEGVTEGYNGTIFAYGQTGCGKSFSMQGITNPATQRGIIPRAFDHIFESVSLAEETKFLIHATYCEIYNEEIRDLLGKDVKAKLDLKEHPEKGVYVSGLSMHQVHNVSECEKIMSKGWNNRATGATLMNADSSRSHSIFTIHLEMISTDENNEEHIRAGKLNLVDLAGSERQAKTGATGSRLKEATKINLSLSALGNVISALVDAKIKHIPYRDSKLTRLLQDSLGGNTKTLMVACLSPADNNYDETLSTLRYANRAKNIQNKPKINEDPKDALLREYQEEIQKLKAMLMGQIPIPQDGFQAGGVPAEKKSRRRSDSGSHLSKEELEQEKIRIREEYEMKMEEMKSEYEKEKIGKAKLEQNLIKLRQFYDSKLSNVDGQIQDLPPTAAVLGEIDWHEDLDVAGPAGEPSVFVQGDDGEEVVVPPEWAEHAGDSEQRRQSERKKKKRLRTKQRINREGEPILPGREGDEGLGDEEEEEEEGDEFFEEEEDESEEEFDERPDSVMGSSMPEGPGMEEGQLTNRSKQKQQHMTENGMVAPSSSPTLTNIQNTEQFRFQQEEAMKRIHELEQQMVGGENKNNKELKKKKEKRLKFADDRKQKLAEAIANMDDDYIMLEIYDNVQDEVKAKSELIEKEKSKIESLQREVLDLQAEFEFERIDYLDTIRKQERQMELLEALLDRMQPALRKDCNYSNLDRVKKECKFDENENRWILPKMMIQTTSLPVAGNNSTASPPTSYSTTEGVMPAAKGMRGRQSVNGDIQASIYDNEEDRFREKMLRRDDRSNQYFQSKRANQLLGPNVAEPVNKINMNEIKNTMKMRTSSPVTNGYNIDPMSKDLRAAAVHGTLIQEDNMVRRPMRLESLPAGPKKGKKKKNALDPL